MKNLKNQKGITLVALVVTIIVLLILAGVSLSLVAGSEGILGKASNAVDVNQIASIKERVEMKIAEEVENYYEAKYVDRTIDNNITALQYLKGDTNTKRTESEDTSLRTKITDGNANYTITIKDIDTTTNTAEIEVLYKKGNTTLTGGTGSGKVADLAGTMQSSGSIIWNKDAAE